MRLLLASCLVALLLLVSGVAEAGATGNRAAADALFREAVQRAEAGDYAGAISKFSASYELDPARGTLQGLAMAEEKAGRVLDAYTHFQELAEVSQKAQDATREQAAREHLASLKGRVPSLKVSFAADVPYGTRVEVDGKQLPEGAIGSALPINPGDHVVRAHGPGGRTFSLMVGVSEGARAKVEITLKNATDSASGGEQASPKAPPSGKVESGATSPDLRMVGLIVGGAGVVLLGVGSYLYLSAGGDYKDLQNRCANNSCPAGSQDQIDSGRSKESWGRVGLIGGGLAVAGGATLFVIGSRSQHEPGVAAALSPTGVTLRGRF